MIDDDFDDWLDDLMDAGDDDTKDFVQFGFGDAGDGQGRAPASRSDAPASPWLDTDQVAAYFGVARRTITNWMQDTPNQFRPWVKVGGTIRWDRDGLDLWLRRLGKGGK